MEDERIGFSAHDLYLELRALRVQSQTLCDRLDATLAVLGPVLRGDDDEAKPRQPGATYVGEAVVQARPRDVEQTLRSHINMVLLAAGRALTSAEIITALMGAIEHRYERLSRKQVGELLHAMLGEGALYCEARGRLNYWSLPESAAQQAQ